MARKYFYGFLAMRHFCKEHFKCEITVKFCDFNFEI
jgi:hypothetical protein